MAVLAVLSIGLPDAWRALHVALVEHVACPYDGALVHEDDVPTAARSRARADEHQKSFVPEHHHQRCAGGDCYQQPSPLPTVSEPALHAVLASQILETEPARLGWSRSVLSYAPKLPPPFCAGIG